MYKSLFLVILSAVLFMGCAGKSGTASYQQAKIEKPANYEKVKQAYAKEETSYALASRWYHRSEALELTIIGPVYKDPKEKKTKAYKKLAALLKKIAKDPKILDKLSDADISKHYTKITYIPYKLGSRQDTKFSAAFANRLDDKETLNAVLQELDAYGEDTNNQVLALWINAEDLKQNIYTLEGYKSVKAEGKQRNSIYYHLSKQNSKGEDNKEIVNAFLATLQLEIPEYVSIDRKDMLKQGETFRIITDNANGTAKGTVYKFDIQSEVDTLEKQKIRTNSVQEKEKIEQEIKAIKASLQWREYETKQHLYTSCISQDDIDTLFRHEYISKVYRYDYLDKKEAQEIGQTMHLSLGDAFIMVSFEKFRMALNELGIKVGRIQNVGKAYYLMGENRVKQLDSHNVSMTADMASMIIPGLSYYQLATMDNGSIEDIDELKEDEKRGKFFAMSSLSGNQAYKKVYENTYTGIGFEYKNMKLEDGDMYGVFVGNNHISYFRTDTMSVEICSAQTGFECKSLKTGPQVKNHDIFFTGMSVDDKYVYLFAFSTGLFAGDSIFQVREVSTGKLIHTKSFDISYQAFNGMIVNSEDGRYFAIIGAAEIHLFDAKTFKYLHTFSDIDAGTGSQIPPVFSDKGNYISIGEIDMSGYGEVLANIYSTKDYKLVASYDLPSTYRHQWFWFRLGMVSPLYFEEDKETLYLRTGATSLVKWNYKTNTAPESDRIAPESVSVFNSIVIGNASPDNHYLLVTEPAMSEGRFHLYDRDSKQYDMSYNYTGIGNAQFMKNGRFIVMPMYGMGLTSTGTTVAIKIFDISVLEIAKGEF